MKVWIVDGCSGAEAVFDSEEKANKWVKESDIEGWEIQEWEVK
jgi:hypothetical protein